MIYEGQAITVKPLEEGIAELQFNLQGESVNKFNRATLEELREAVDAIRGNDQIKGLIVTSGKEVFIVGADIGEFLANFTLPEDELITANLQINQIFSDFEDLPMPTVVAINGIALGGGFEMCLAADYRVMADTAKVGLPEVKLGIYPGFGGTVRLPRIVGADNAIEWICAGKEHKAEAALKTKAVDVVVPLDELKTAAITLAKRAAAGELDYQARRQPKLEKLKLNNIESMMVFETAKGYVASQAGPHYPAPVEAIKTIQKAATKGRDDALKIEAKGFVKMAKTPVAENLIGLFLKDQLLKKKAKHYEEIALSANKAAVLGAGIMGGGIAYQSSYKNVPILMKDINQDGIDLGLSEAAKLLVKRVDRKRMEPAAMAEVLNRIIPTLSYGDFNTVDVVVEAVVENIDVKKKVLAEVEGQIKPEAVLTTNTSTISINKLAEAVKRPEKFCGMHFFNPVHMMPLVEVIKGEQTSEETVATVVAYAKTIGKTPIVVNDCPGFLVNRILFPYFGAFSMLLRDGADFAQVDKVMERFGWPMGPAYLMDVVGLDTGLHAEGVMAEGFPDRMKREFKTALDVLYEAKRYGQKSNAGFYQYKQDKKGKPKKVLDETVYDMIKPVCQASQTFSEEDIIARMMVPLCLETVRCLEDGIVESPAEADMGLVYGIGFPPFRGGALKYIDDMGVAEFVALTEKFAELGPLYKPTAKLIDMAKSGARFFTE
ncbi:fatty acid oxidation complex subunit alpha FadB [Endozoicomonas sp. SM1973]|uniref:enoyl-CoA hydratase n=1 Tax=Spartinivicinus marinus TaxID=2994442 RepID=A0A853I3Y6_9GAMM|nr:fatty acid oxidation complex subunit alpha FadB [Spartinivicinus marinus]MCX4029742.1 fatty acid oxidation complex subunit alpha FadB [Spartinivicinus marinus]NYZ68073.1 fatty acid oxidation complex subunit alpha FadB [Spartinivicinus marinus]